MHYIYDNWYTWECSNLYLHGDTQFSGRYHAGILVFTYLLLVLDRLIHHRFIPQNTNKLYVETRKDTAGKT